jgi:hypothetical protein
MATCEFDESNVNWSGGAGSEGEYVERSSTRKIWEKQEHFEWKQKHGRSHGGSMGFARKPFLEKSEVYISDDLLTRTKCKTF